jgi:LysM repeat protein
MFDHRFIRSVGLLLAALAVVLILGLRSAPESEGSAPTRTVVVQPGDTLWDIAEAAGDGDPRELVGEIRAINGLDDAVIRPGQELRLPPGV